jgi:2-C-methyl-D-erythritol 4-phosphate cytidylyltransferase
MLEDFSQNSFDGSVLGSPVTDSIKRLSPQTQTINNTINRETLWRAFTPQIFCKQILEKAYKNSKEGTEFSDESSMVEKLSSNIKAYNGSGDNIKITHPEDINLAKSILVSQGRVDK